MHCVSKYLVQSSNIPSPYVGTTSRLLVGSLCIMCNVLKLVLLALLGLTGVVMHFPFIRVVYSYGVYASCVLSLNCFGSLFGIDGSGSALSFLA